MYRSFVACIRLVVAQKSFVKCWRLMSAGAGFPYGAVYLDPETVLRDFFGRLFAATESATAIVATCITGHFAKLGWVPDFRLTASSDHDDSVPRLGLIPRRPALPRT